MYYYDLYFICIITSNTILFTIRKKQFKVNIMHADLKGALRAIKTSWKAFEHNGKPMTKEQVKKILEYGIKKSYETTADFKFGEVDSVLNNN